MPQMPQSVKNYGVSVKKSLAFPLLVDLGQVAERHVRQQLPVQLRDDQHQRRHRAHPGRRPDQPVRRQRLRDARLAAAGRHRPARPDRAGHRQRDQPAEPAEPGRPDRRAAGGDRHRVHLHGPHAGPPAERGGVRQHHRPHATRTARRCGSRTSRASSSARSSTTRSAATTASRRRSSPSSRSPASNALDVADRDQGDDGRADDALPAGPGVRSSRSTPRCRSPRASTRSSTRCSKRWCS